MQYQIYNPKAEQIGFLMAYADATEAQAIMETNDKWEYEQLRLRVAVRTCKAAGHKLVDAGSHAGPEGAADNFECRRCGWTFHHTYF